MIESKLLLNPDDIFNLWSIFGEAIGMDKLHQFYGNYWPRKPLSGEMVWKWTKGNKTIGWSAIRQDILDPIIFLMVGIFPEHQYLGNSKIIIRWTVEEGFNIFSDCSWLFVAVSKKNKDHLETRMRYQAKHPTKWIIAGEMNVPEPGYVIFGIERDRFFEPKKLLEDDFPEGTIDYPLASLIEEKSFYDYVRETN